MRAAAKGAADRAAAAGGGVEGLIEGRVGGRIGGVNEGSYAALLIACEREGWVDVAFDTLAAMRRQGITPSTKHLTVVIRTCARQGDRSKVKRFTILHIIKICLEFIRNDVIKF